MAEVWMYTVGASSDPDWINCVVPSPVDEDLTFFGPCAKSIRKDLRRRFLLRPGVTHSTKARDSDIFIAGVNGSNDRQVRKVVWAGRLSEVMTFQEADNRLRGGRFRQMREDPFSPLHVRPVEKGGKLVGYVHVSMLHAEREKGKPHDKWVYDLVSGPEAFEITPKEGQQRMILRRAPTQDFDRDCCMLLEECFFAQGQGIAFGEGALKILRQAQRGESKIDRYAVFGRTTGGDAKGLRGTYLPITGKLADHFVEWLGPRSREAVKHQRRDWDGLAKSCCSQTALPRRRRSD